jgi:hypothetical protein
VGGVYIPNLHTPITLAKKPHIIIFPIFYFTRLYALIHSHANLELDKFHIQEAFSLFIFFNFNDPSSNGVIQIKSL